MCYTYYHPHHSLHSLILYCGLDCGDIAGQSLKFCVLLLYLSLQSTHQLLRFNETIHIIIHYLWSTTKCKKSSKKKINIVARPIRKVLHLLHVFPHLVKRRGSCCETSYEVYPWLTILGRPWAWGTRVANLNFPGRRTWAVGNPSSCDREQGLGLNMATTNDATTNDAATSSMTEKKAGELYPPIEPYNIGWLRVSDIHEIYYEESGNKDGKPVIFLLVY